MAKKLTKAEQAKLKKKRDMEVMFWGIAGCVILIGITLGWGKLAPMNEEEVNSMIDMQIDDILDLFQETGEETSDGRYAMTPDQLRDILEMVLKEDDA